MIDEYWGLSLDDMTTEIWEIGSGDAIGAHYIAFTGDRVIARDKMITLFTELIDRMLYRANPYGSPWSEDDDDE